MMKQFITIHHSVSPDHPDLLNIEAIRNWHVKVNGWRDIGYSHVLEQIGGHWEVVLGRIPWDDLAHAPQMGMNKLSYAICCVGNFDVEVPSVGMMDKLKALVVALMKQDGIPLENVLGHWEVQAGGGVPIAERKSCPGKLLHMPDFRESIKYAFP